MLASAAPYPVVPSASPLPTLAELWVDERDADTRGVLIPRPEIQLVVRFGPSTRDGLDVYAFGARERVHRKLIRGGQRTVAARLRLGAHQAVLSVPASALSGRTVPLEELWGVSETRALTDRLAEARNSQDAAGILQRTIERRAARGSARNGSDVRLAFEAASRLARGNVSAVSLELGVSERHLRRLFYEAFGINPKGFAKLTRFRRALRAARAARSLNWAAIALNAGYYDQAHLIREFRSTSGQTPRALLEELSTSFSSG